MRLQHPTYFKHHFCLGLLVNFIFHFEQNYGLLVKLIIVSNKEKMKIIVVIVIVSIMQGFWYFAEKKAKFRGIFRGKFAEKSPISRDFRGKKVKIHGTIGRFRAIFEGEKSKFEENRPISRDFSGKKSIFEGFSAANS